MFLSPTPETAINYKIYIMNCIVWQTRMATGNKNIIILTLKVIKYIIMQWL